MRTIDADALRKRFEVATLDCLGMEPTFRGDEVKDEIDNAPTIDAIPVDWMLQRMNETASGEGLNVELNNALFTVGVEWERWKKENATD